MFGGGDVALADLETHKDLEEYLEQIKRYLGVDYTFIKSSCREMYNEQMISKLTALKLHPKDNHGWWASIAHVLAMLAVLAPYAYAKRIGINMLASSYSKNGKVADANNEALLNAIRFASCKMLSIDGDIDRTDKAKKIIKFAQTEKMPIRLKVCWFRNAGGNCSHCEKCYRTILDILVNHADPNEFGFNVQKDTFRSMKEYLEENYVNKIYWKEIQDKFLQEKEYWIQNNDISWILDFRFNKPRAIFNKAKSVARKFI